MPKKQKVPTLVPPGRYFVNELPGETPPSLRVMEELYDLASDLFGLRPWQYLTEENLIVVRDNVRDERYYCSVMGALGEVFSLHAYLGAEAHRLLRKMQAGETTDPGEFFASTHCIYVEFVPSAELLRQDRELLAALGHPQGRNLASPIFRTIRPGFVPWFVTEDEARILLGCIQAVIVICAAFMTTESGANFWKSPDTSPMVTLDDSAERRFHVEKFIRPPRPSQWFGQRV